jgi:glutamine phosphoribosylpyrophosphate amidotransferase
MIEAWWWLEELANTNFIGGINMCAVIGVYLKNVEEEDLALIEMLFYESQIRGKHSTGMSYLRDDNTIATFKDNLPVGEFFSKYDLYDAVHGDGGVYLIGHTRYSTSDLRYPQPLSNGKVSIVHNGVVTQEPPEEWMYQCQTKNDSELILRSLEIDSHPFIDFPTASMAVVALNEQKQLTAFRNHERPLWYSMHPRGIIFTSTADIARRAGLSNPQKTDQLHNYVVENYKLKVYDCTIPFDINYVFEDLQ